MHFLLCSRILATALALVVPATLGVRAETVTPVRVALPLGLTASDRGTAASKLPGSKYVTVEGVRIFNPSREVAQSYDRRDFHLLVGDSVYTPVVRPGLGAVDFESASLLGPLEATLVTVTFLVPARTTSAKLEFTPHWYGDDGHTVDFCCLYL